MCGLYGFVTTRPKKRNVNALRALGILMEKRGDHSTGVAEFSGSSVKIQKDAVDASRFFSKERIISPNAWGCIGHTRQATHGARTAENAHPFQYDFITGAHNGVIYNYKDFGEFEVDSQAIFFLLNKYTNNYVRAFKEIRGSAAITWMCGYNLYMVRHENPLFLTITEDTVLWASEYDAIRAVTEAIGVEDAEISSLKENVVLRVNARDLTFKSTEVKFKEWSYVDWNKENDKNNKKNRNNSSYWNGQKDEKDYEWVKDENTGLFERREKKKEVPKQTALLEDGNSSNPAKQTGDEKGDKFDDDNPMTEEDWKDYIVSYAREFADESGCKLCNNPIGRTELFYINDTTGQTICIRCFRNPDSRAMIPLEAKQSLVLVDN